MTSAIATNPPSSMEVQQKARALALKDLLTQKKSSFASIANKHLNPERMLRLTLAAASRQPKILECTPASVLGALMDCAKLGLEPIGRGGMWLVPFKNKKNGRLECTPITDYRGELALARRSGQILSISTHPVYDGEVFEVEYGDAERLVHRPDLTAERKDELEGLRCVYAIGRLKDGGIQRAVLTLADIEKYRAKSRAGDSGPWVTDYVAMALKTALRRLCNLLPMDLDYREHVEKEEATEYSGTDIVTVVDFEEEPEPATKEAQLMEALEKKRDAKVAPAPEPTPAPPPKEEPIDTSPEPKIAGLDQLRLLHDQVLEYAEGDVDFAKTVWGSTLAPVESHNESNAPAAVSKAKTLIKKLGIITKAATVAGELREMDIAHAPIPEQAYSLTLAALEGILSELERRRASR